jgi:arylsulfatase A-like enzyme
MKTFTRREILTLLTSVVPFSKLFANQSSFDSTRPNIIFIMADDLGWADLSCYGRKEYTTPNLDWLANNGIKFTNAYSASPVCTPTRCAFNTGRYPARTPVGLKEPLSWKKNIGTSIGLDPSYPTIASLLSSNGYFTSLIGKWHLGYLPKFSPLKSGFHEFFGIMSGGVDYFSHKDGAGEPDLFEDEVPVEKSGYITDLITQKAIEFISRKHERPFFLSLNYTAPHWPWEGPDDIGKDQVIKSWTTDGGSIEVYSKMVKSMDDGIGRLISSLKIKKLIKNTLIVFTSDNGGERFSYNWPFSGQKFELLEGGIRVPAIAYWRGIIPKGVTTDQVAITMDWTKTFLDISNTQENPDYPLDGVDLLPILTGKQKPFERKLYWRTKDQTAIRFGHWKYFRKIDRMKDCAIENEYLFDLDFDKMEKSNFKEENPGIFEQLKRDYEQWNAQVLKYE